MNTDDDSFYSANESASSTSSDDSFCSMVATTGELIRGKFNLENRVTFNVCHINAQSIASHYSELDVTFTDANVHAVLISESWLKPHLPSAAYPLPGFILIRNDRVDRRGGV